MKTILITGATGFLGGHCVESMSKSARVVAVGRDRDALASLETRAGTSGLSLVAERIDLTSLDAPARLAHHRPDAIVHAAARSSPWGTAEEFEAANVAATRAVLGAATECAAPVVYVSTPSVYMNGSPVVDVDEKARLPRSFINDYTASKFAGEELVRAWSKSSVLPAAILRPQAIVGPGDTTLAPRFLRVIDRGFLPLFNEGRARLDATHVANVVQSIELSLDAFDSAKWTGAETFNIANGEPQTVREFLELIVDARTTAQPSSRTPRFVNLGRSFSTRIASAMELVSRLTGRWEPPLTAYTVEALSLDRTLDIAKARDVLGYDPSAHSVADAIADYFDAVMS